ncbi:MAG: ClpX C4-type zinc finger protein [Pseudomonadota bacterium]
MDSNPPPIIDSARVIVFAFNDTEVKYTDKIELHIGDEDGGFQRLGEVPQLAIARPYNNPGEVLLMFCNASWQAKGVIAFTNIEEAKIKAERGYQGITDKWKYSPYSEEEINNFLRDEYEVDPRSEWWTTICSFCGKKGSELESVLVGKYASICKNCVLSFYKVFNENA